MDLSPDCRGVEQFGMGFEYAGVSSYAGAFFDMTKLVSGDRLSGTPFTRLSGSQATLGIDGCPVVLEWVKRVFTPMLAALGPSKYNLYGIVQVRPHL